jgi:hypothetical protein
MSTTPTPEIIMWLQEQVRDHQRLIAHWDQVEPNSTNPTLAEFRDSRRKYAAAADALSATPSRDELLAMVDAQREVLANQLLAIDQGFFYRADGLCECTECDAVAGESAAINHADDCNNGMLRNVLIAEPNSFADALADLKSRISQEVLMSDAADHLRYVDECDVIAELRRMADEGKR